MVVAGWGPLRRSSVSRIAVLALLGAVVGGDPAAAEARTVTEAFQGGVAPSRDYDGARDTYVAASKPDEEFGRDEELVVDGDRPNGSGRDYVALMAWDISRIPEGSKVVGASIAINVTQKSEQQYQVYESLVDWDDRETTWETYRKGWGDEVLGVVDSRAGSATLNDAGLAVVESWVNGSEPNRGFVILNTEADDGLKFSSSDDDDRKDRPRLEITFAAPDTGAVESSVESLEVAAVSRGGSESNETRDRSIPDPITTDRPIRSGSSGFGAGQVYHVSPDGDDDADGRSAAAALQSIQEGLRRAMPGDVVRLGPGVYMQDVRSVRHGTAEQPIFITGTPGAVIKGGGDDRIVEINHDFITISDLEIDGKFDEDDDLDSYRGTLLWAQGTEPFDGVEGMRILSVAFQNARGRCVRLRYYASDNEIAYSTFRNCGVRDFKFDQGGKSGEGVYIGTSPKQYGDGKSPTDGVDISQNNWVHHNTFDTQGNECVEVKEGSFGNIVEHNFCTGQLDPNSGGLGSRGSGNIFRYNTVWGNVGAGIRVGGAEETDGVGNDIYGNQFVDNEAGAVKLQRGPQGRICGNVVRFNPGGVSVGTFGDTVEPRQPCT